MAHGQRFGLRTAFVMVLSAASFCAGWTAYKHWPKRQVEQATASLSMAPFEFRREGANSPEDAATALFRGCAIKSPKHFVQHLLLGVCDGPVDTLQKFAESLHTTRFNTGEESFTVYDLPKGINNDTLRIIRSGSFDSLNKDVIALNLQSVSTYYGEQFRFVDVAADGFDGREYTTRVVVAIVQGRWYAIPRCRSSKSFYEIADAMKIDT